jgi:VWFA-related protein
LSVKGRFAIALIAAAASIAAFQTTDSASQTPTFRLTTRLVQVNVVAVDKDGKAVADLRREEFSLSEDGRPQNIAVFAAESANPVKPPILPRNEFSNELPSGDSSRSGYTLILIDWLNSATYSRMDSHRQVLKLLQQVEISDRVALCVLDRDLRVLHDFTADRADLIRKLSAANMGLSQGPSGEQAGIAEFPLFSTAVEHSPTADVAERRTTRYVEIRRTLDTFRAIEQIASYLGTARGRKSMIWVTSGFPSALGFDGDRTENPEAWSSIVSDDRRTFSADVTRLLRRLNDADIAVYPVDARGLIADADRAKASRAYVNLAGMKEIAARTGGRTFYHGNDLDQAIRSALDDTKVSYTLGYYPSNPKKDGSYRNLSVRVNRPGVVLRYRTGYDAESDRPPQTRHKVDLVQVFGSPLDTTSIPLKAHAVRAGNKLDVSLRFDPAALTFRQEKGRRKGAISVLYGFRPPGDSGKIQIYSESKKLELPEEQYSTLLRHGLRTFRKQIPLAANATSLRLALRDEESGLVGSVTIPLKDVQLNDLSTSGADAK